VATESGAQNSADFGSGDEEQHPMDTEALEDSFTDDQHSRTSTTSQPETADSQAGESGSNLPGDTSGSKLVPNTRWWIPAEGIRRDVIQADIRHYLGPEVTVRPGEGEGADRVRRVSRYEEPSANR
jgi:hypothetical protein